MRPRSLSSARALLPLVAVLGLGLAGPVPAGSAESAWPLADRQGAVGLRFGYVVQPKLERQVFNDGYFLNVAEGTPVLAMGAGRIVHVSFTYLAPDMGNSLGVSLAKGMTQDAAFLSAAESARRAGVPPDHFSGAVTLDLGDGRKIHYLGLALPVAVQEGQRVKQGETIGQSAFVRSISDQPGIRVALSRLGKPSDIGVMLFGPGYASGDSVITAPPKYEPDRRYAAVELRADFQKVRAALEEGHPGLYTYTPKAEMDRLFEAGLTAIDRDLTENEFVEILNGVLSAIRCNHTNIVRSLSYEQRPRRILPFEVHFEGDRCWSKRDYGLAPRVAHGTEILTIDGVPPAEARARIARRYYPDGFNASFQQAMSEARFLLDYCELRGEPDSIRLRVRRETGEEEEFSQPTVAIWEFAKAQRKQTPLRINREFSCQILDERSAVMSIPSFETMNREEIDQWFGELDAKRISNLILDLRNNSGGSLDNLRYFYSYFARGPFQCPRYSLANSDSSYSFFKDTDNRLPGSTMYGVWRPHAESGGFRQDGPISEPHETHHYNGQVYVLINGRTLSAAAVCAGLLMRDNGAVLVGAETGGGYYLNSAEQWANLMLKCAPLTIHFPLLQLVFAEEGHARIPRGRGVPPDYEVRGSLEDIRNNVDRQFEFARSLLAVNGGDGGPNAGG